MTTTEIKIAKLSDASEAAHLEKSLEAVPRVRSVRVDHDANSAYVEHDGADLQALTDAVKRLGYPAAIH